MKSPSNIYISNKPRTLQINTKSFLIYRVIDKSKPLKPRTLNTELVLRKSPLNIKPFPSNGPLNTKLLPSNRPIKTNRINNSI